MPASRPYWDEQEMIQNNDRPEILAIGDSWFWYPFNNLLNPVFNASGGRVTLAIGRNGALLSDFVGGPYSNQVTESLSYYRNTIRAVLLSAGGNHFAGLQDFDLILKDDCRQAKTVAECYESGEPKRLFDTIENYYRTLILRIQREVPNAAVLTHNYDYAFPSGQGFVGMGSWLKKPLDVARVSRKLHVPLINDLIDTFGRRLAKLAKEYEHVHFVKSAGVLAPGEWANELHPTPSGFEKIARQRWKPVIEKIFP